MTTKPARATRDERIRNELFGEAPNEVFDNKTKGFVPLPIEFRLLLRHLTLAQSRVLLYLHLRSGKEGISFPTLDQIAHDIGVNTARHVRPLIFELERKGFIRSARKGGTTYYLVLDPAITILRLLELKEMSSEQLRHMNDLRESINHEPIDFEDGAE